MKRIALAALASIVWATAQGASFDCAKASTKVEHIICDDHDISRLDNELAFWYRRATRDQTAAIQIKQAQQKWLKERDACQDVSCVRQAYETRVAALMEDARPNYRYHFELTKGAGTPVCDAYLERLNTTAYDSPPYCDRPETTSIPGFAFLNRVPLSPEAVHALFPRVSKFVGIGKQGSKEEDEANEAILKRNRVGPRIDPDPLNEIAELLQHGELVAWRYNPPVDIDNDGTPDDVLMWQGYGLGGPLGVCGQPTNYGGFTSDGSQPQIAFVLTADNSRLDVEKTKQVFGHPSGGYRLSNGEKDPSFRPIGFRIAIFKYQDKYYFDTFFDQWGDFQNKRKGDPKLQDTLGVFLRKNGETQQVCEYYMSRPDTKTEEDKQ